MALEPLRMLPEVPDQQFNQGWVCGVLQGGTVSSGGWHRVDHPFVRSLGSASVRQFGAG
jgi:hypothetical protein